MDFWVYLAMLIAFDCLVIFTAIVSKERLFKANIAVIIVNILLMILKKLYDISDKL